ncbi:peptide/nickel transport system permease protein [Paenibacillus sophorae]|uniref:ABC transporter permease n=1 Tax=Paenibacillus sophorae TaxID=1333845 RepID=A0A1H8TLG2_9BACL|nr:ABC transporter permease [Paenibacillus sophorae]QWU16277.1 ABC transporter permease [Paenibacillus sophorae]SEO91636.1 peptide/nickel transport system permease protein [Paenibacillus sophorae]
MLKFALRRLAGTVPLLLLISVLVFALAKQMPGDGLGGGLNPGNKDPRYITEMRKKLGYDDPLAIQYIRWLKDAAAGNFGQSFLYKMPVGELIGQRLPATLLLTALSLLITYGSSLALGMIAGRNPGSRLDRLIRTAAYVTYAIPTFIAAIFAIYIFAVMLHWVPLGGTVSVVTSRGMSSLGDRVVHALLPAAVLGLFNTAAYTQFLRNEIVENSDKNYVRTAVAKGISRSSVYNRHILRNSLIPLVTFLGMDIGGLLGGSVVIENLFAYPGIGTLFVAAVSGRDYAVMMAITLMTGFMIVAGNVVADVLYGWLDPRIRAGYNGGRS